MYKRPGSFFDLTKFDFMEVPVASKLMNSMKLRLLTDDPVYYSWTYDRGDWTQPPSEGVR